MEVTFCRIAGSNKCYNGCDVICDNALTLNAHIRDAGCSHWKRCHNGCGATFNDESAFNSHIHNKVCKPKYYSHTANGRKYIFGVSTTATPLCLEHITERTAKYDEYGNQLEPNVYISDVCDTIMLDKIRRDINTCKNFNIGRSIVKNND